MAARSTATNRSTRSTEANYRRIRPIFADHLGVARSKYLPVAFAGHGTKHCMTLFAQHFDKQMTPTTPHSGFLTGLPDVEAVYDLADARPGWDDGVGVVVADLQYEGRLVANAPRTVLRRAVDAWQQLGYMPMVGIELEAYILEPNGSGGWKAIDTPGGMTYGVGPFVDPHGLLDDIMSMAEHCGFPLESVNSEYDVPQFELTLRYGEALAAIDNVFLFKQMAQEIARKKGLHLTFLGKPFGGLAGSGLHVNFSLNDKRGKNAFNEPKKPHGLADVARHSIGGLLEHHEAMTAICAPTVNAYKRLRPGTLAGVWANWGLDHRNATVRVPKERDAGTRIEYRLPDGSANVYLATAAVLQAALLGVRSNIEPPAIEDGDAFETANTDRRTPANLGDACDALEADQVFSEAFGREAVEVHLAIKRDEWRKFNEAVTDWELGYYLPYL
jgi:glutamine synthetase